MSVQSEITRLNNTVAEQAALIQEITDILEEKAGGGGSNTVFHIKQVRFENYGPIDVKDPKINIIIMGKKASDTKEIFDTTVSFGNYDTDFMIDTSVERIFIKVDCTTYAYNYEINENTLRVYAKTIDAPKITEIYFGGFTDHLGNDDYTINKMDCFIHSSFEETVEIYDFQNYTDTPFVDFESFIVNPDSLPITSILGAVIDDGNTDGSWVGSQCYIKDNKMYIKVCFWI